MRRLLWVLPLLAIFACGKNDGVTGAGYAPVPQPAIIPQAPGGYPGGYPGSYPPPPYGGASPYFQPQMPSGYPSQYTPFLPLDNYMRRYPQTQQYWGGMWSDWRIYAGQQGYSPYNFTVFWYDFCPQYGGQQFQPIYNYFSQNYYSWMSPQTQFPQQMNPNYFWSNYQGMPYYGADVYCEFCF